MTASAPNPVDFVFGILQRDMRTMTMLNRPCLSLWCRWVRDLARDTALYRRVRDDAHG